MPHRGRSASLARRGGGFGKPGGAAASQGAERCAHPDCERGSGSGGGPGRTPADGHCRRARHHDCASGISISQAGFGQVTVRAQIQAITLPFVPSGSFAFG